MKSIIFTVSIFAASLGIQTSHADVELRNGICYRACSNYYESCINTSAENCEKSLEDCYIQADQLVVEALTQACTGFFKNSGSTTDEALADCHKAAGMNGASICKDF